MGLCTTFVLGLDVEYASYVQLGYCALPPSVLYAARLQLQDKSRINIIRITSLLLPPLKPNNRKILRRETNATVLNSTSFFAARSLSRANPSYSFKLQLRTVHSQTLSHHKPSEAHCGSAHADSDVFTSSPNEILPARLLHLLLLPAPYHAVTHHHHATESR